MERSKLKSAVLAFVQPLSSGVIRNVGKTFMFLDGLVGFGQRKAIKPSPYGLVTKQPKGVVAYFQNLMGDILKPVVVAELDKLRPEPSEDGEVIMYCRQGANFPCIITLKPSGTIEITTDKDVIVTSPKTVVKSAAVELGDGALEKIVNGETFQTLFNSHQHSGNMGVPTGAPLTPMAAAHLSTVVKGAK